MTTLFRKLVLASVMATSVIFPASAQTYLAVIWGTESIHYFASPGDTLYLGDTKSGIHLCVAFRPIIYDNSRYAQFFLPNGRPIYTFWTSAAGSFSLDPANDKKCQAHAAQYAQATGLPVQNAAGSSQTTVKPHVPDSSNSHPVADAPPDIWGTVSKIADAYNNNMPKFNRLYYQKSFNFTGKYFSDERMDDGSGYALLFEPGDSGLEGILSRYFIVCAGVNEENVLDRVNDDWTHSRRKIRVQGLIEDVAGITLRLSNCQLTEQ